VGGGVPRDHVRGGRSLLLVATITMMRDQRRIGTHTFLVTASEGLAHWGCSGRSCRRIRTKRNVGGQQKRREKVRSQPGGENLSPKTGGDDVTAGRVRLLNCGVKKPSCKRGAGQEKKVRLSAFDGVRGKKWRGK